MKFQVTDKQYDQLIQIKGYMLMNEFGSLFTITDFTVEKGEKTVGLFKKRTEPTYYITNITIKTYNPSGHFVGTYLEEDAIAILSHYTDPLLNISFYTPRNLFLQLVEAFKCFGFEIKKIETPVPETK